MLVLLLPGVQVVIGMTDDPGDRICGLPVGDRVTSSLDFRVEQAIRVRVLLDATVIKPPYSGVHLSVLHQTRAMIRCLGCETVLPVCADPSAANVLQECGANVRSVSPLICHVALRIAWQQTILPRLLKREDVQILHAMAYTAPLFCPVPYLLTVHDIIALTNPELCSPGNVIHMRVLLPRSVRRAACNVVSTSYVADGLLRTLAIPKSRIEVVPLGVDYAHFSSPVPRSLVPGLPSEPYLLFVGNLEPKKGLEDLLRAFAGLHERTGIHLVVAGRRAWRSARLFAALQHEISRGRVSWLGRVNDEQLCALYQHAAAFVFPSVEEGFGMPVLEAMAAGTPVIHSDHPAVLEAAGGAGLAFPCSNAAALTDTLARLLTTPALRRELVEAGQIHARSRSWDSWARHVGEIYSSVVSEG